MSCHYTFMVSTQAQFTSRVENDFAEYV
jgi:hypothetical protein